MRFSFTDDQRAFADGLGEMLTREFPASCLREMWEAHEGHDPAMWQRLCDMGVLAMLVPEEAGGMGGQMVDAVLLFEAMGRAALPGPVIEHIVLSPVLVGTEFGEGVLDGSTIATAALFGESHIAHADVASIIVTPEGACSGFSATMSDGIDEGRHLGTVDGGTATPLEVDVEATRDRLSIAAAAYLIGLGTTMIDIAGDYARQREQFGKPIGAFQAVKHLMANALLKVEFAKAPTYRAAWSVDADPANGPRDASMAKALASEAGYAASRAAMQVHGGIGYTWEADIQLFMKKAWALQRAFGDARTHRRRVSDALLGARG